MTKPDQSEGDRSRDEVLAGEYVLGVLSSEARARVEARLRHDRAFAAIVARWEENLSPIDEEFQPVLVSDLVLPRIESRLFGPQRRPPGLLHALWASATLWRAVSLACVLALVVVLVLDDRMAAPPARTTSLVAELQSQKGDAVSLLAGYDPGTGTLQLTPVAVSSADQRSLELWMIRGSDAPVSLGVLPQSGHGDVRVPEQLRKQVSEGVTLAVSLEPFGGSATGKPTGPVLALGQTRRP